MSNAQTLIVPTVVDVAKLAMKLRAQVPCYVHDDDAIVEAVEQTVAWFHQNVDAETGWVHESAMITAHSVLDDIANFAGD